MNLIGDSGCKFISQAEWYQLEFVYLCNWAFMKRTTKSVIQAVPI